MSDENSHTICSRITPKGRVAINKLLEQERVRTGYDIRVSDIIARAIATTFDIDIVEFSDSKEG